MRTMAFLAILTFGEILAKHWGVYEEPKHGEISAWIFLGCVLLDIFK